MDQLIRTMVTPIGDRDSAAAVVPLVIKLPDDAIGKVQHLSFSTPFDAQLSEREEKVVRRVAIGMDLPPEVLLGLGDSNHWSAWQIQESSITLYVEPLLGLICQALTHNYFRPALQALGVNVDRLVVWYDTSDLRLRPNRGPEALELHNRELLSDEALLREHGFGVEDLPSDLERQRRLAWKLAQQHRDLLPALASLIGLDALTQQPPAGDGTVERQPPGGPSLPSSPRPELPGSDRDAVLPDSAAAGLAAAAEGENAWQVAALDHAVRGVLERVGKRLLRGSPRSFQAKLADVPLWEVHCHLSGDVDQLGGLLDDALTAAVAPLPASPCLRNVLNSYVQALITTGQPHQRRYLTAMARQVDCDAAA
ncbi:hypothetical protein ACQEVF_56700 [Nonomuraea polychroma]|uniref:hypothetical protein n=1 Tax=Nonomuraea polychroma TaxID=46176 RepID=UPI003D8F2600